MWKRVVNVLSEDDEMKFLGRFRLVMVLAGVLIMGVMQGSNLIERFRISTARALTTTSPAMSIDGMSLWLDATAVKAFADPHISNSTQIQDWLDTNNQNGLKVNNFFQSIEDKRPTYVAGAINGLPAVRFDGDNDAMGINNFSGYKLLQPDQMSMFMVYRTDPLYKGNGTILYWADINKLNIHDLWASGTRYFDFGPINGRVSRLDPEEAFNPHVFSFVHRPNRAAQINIDGVPVAKATGISRIMNISSMADLSLGAASIGGINPWSGFVGEIIVFNRGLHKEDVLEIEAYLGQKWGILVQM